jgi:hypothetical protein
MGVLSYRANRASSIRDSILSLVPEVMNFLVPDEWEVVPGSCAFQYYVEGLETGRGRGEEREKKCMCMHGETGGEPLHAAHCPCVCHFVIFL